MINSRCPKPASANFMPGATTSTSIVYEALHPCGRPHTYSSLYLVGAATDSARPTSRGTPSTTASLKPLCDELTTLLPLNRTPTPTVQAPLPARFSAGGV